MFADGHYLPDYRPVNAHYSKQLHTSIVTEGELLGILLPNYMHVFSIGSSVGAMRRGKIQDNHNNAKKSSVFLLQL